MKALYTQEGESHRDGENEDLRCEQMEFENRVEQLERDTREMEDENIRLKIQVMEAYKALIKALPGDKDPVEVLMSLAPGVDKELLRSTLAWCQILTESSNDPRDSQRS